MAHTAAVSTAIHEAGPVMLPIPPHLQAGSVLPVRMHSLDGGGGGAAWCRRAAADTR